MRISPVDIRQQQFTVKMFRGLDPNEVDAFLEDVAEDYEMVLKENAALKQQIVAHEERARGITEIERTLKETLVTTQRVADDMKLSAKRESELLVRDAELQGEKLLAEARAEEARLRAEIQELRRRRRQIVEDLRVTLERYQRLVAGDLEEGSEGGDAKPQG